MTVSYYKIQRISSSDFQRAKVMGKLNLATEERSHRPKGGNSEQFIEMTAWMISRYIFRFRRHRKTLEMTMLRSVSNRPYKGIRKLILDKAHATELH